MKSIHRLDHSFEDTGLTLFGGNGSGKTTLLECISLLGHLGVMGLAPIRQEAGRGAFFVGPSLLNAAIAGEDCAAIVGGNESLLHAFESFASHVRGHATSNLPLALEEVRRAEASFELQPGEPLVESAFRSLTSGDSSAPAVLFEVEADTGGEVIPLVVRLTDRNTDLSLALSNEVSDRESERDLTLYFDAESVRAREFILSSLASRPCTVDPVGASQAVPAWRPTDTPKPVVSYVNTDLNDFGRGNDLRESPKNITDDFASVIRRLGIDTSAILAPLNAVLSRILSPDREDRWAIAELSVSGAKTRLVVTDHFGEPQLRNHLSAGENEVFFAFLVLLGLPTRGGIVVLDEPAFHAGPETAPLFFDELYALCARLDIQVFVGSHSAWSLPEESGHPTAALEIPRQKGGAHQLLDALDSRLRFQSLHQDAFQRIERSVKGVEAATRDRARLIAHALKDEIGPLGDRLLWDRMGLFLCLAVLIAGSLQIAVAASFPWNLAGLTLAMAATAVLCWGFWKQVGDLDIRRRELVDEAFLETYETRDLDSNEKRLFRKELENASDWQLRAQLRDLGVPFLDFVPSGGMWRAATFTLGHFAIAATIVWWYTGSWALGGQVALVEPIVNGFWHYLNDHLWRSRASSD